MTVLFADAIASGYGSVEILHGVSVRVEPGEIVSIIGPNGAGKSTLIKAIFGLLPVMRGRVLLGGEEITGLRPDRIVRRGMGYVPQVDNVFPSLTIHENLEMGSYVQPREFDERAHHVYGLFPDLAQRRGERAGRLSGGQRQLLAIGRALMLRPTVLLLDEPSASLSPRMVGVVFEKIAEINRAGTAILMVEQNARHALQLSNRAYVLATGEARLEGDARQLLDSDEVRRLYLGE
jgi:ABC-type branched-subunit amino acid transport system ATPase component